MSMITTLAPRLSAKRTWMGLLGILSFWPAKSSRQVSEEDRAVFEAAAQAAEDYAWDKYIDELESDKQFMIDAGLTVTEITPEDQEAMIEKIQPVYDYLDSQYDWAADIREMIANIE